MTSIITPPLAAYFIWHGSDQKAFDEVCGDFRSYLTRDIDRPFSRELNIPTFFFSGYDHPPKQPNYLAQNNVIFICLNCLKTENQSYQKLFRLLIFKI